MSKRKMCPHYRGSDIEDMCLDGDMAHNGKCPSNTNSICEIAEPKYKRVKAWGNIGCISGKLYSAQVKKDNYHDVPCTILIKRKYLGGKK